MAKRDARQGQLFASAEEAPAKFLFDPRVLRTEEERVDAMADFIIERHKIFLKRQKGLPKPWTTDPVLRASKFTNIYRELDPGTTWIVDNIVKPYEDHPDLWFMLCAARLINWPPTLQRLMDDGVWPVKTWNTERVYQSLVRYKEAGNKLITGAYIVNSVFPPRYPKREGSKAEYIPFVGLAPLWERRKEVRHVFKTTMVDSLAALTSFHGWGAFMSNQVLVDLSYSKKWLGRAPDLNTFTSPGPGTTKGMNWLLNGHMQAVYKGDKLNEPMIRTRDLVNAAVRAKVPAKYWTEDPWTGFATISMPNYSNCHCETSKMVRSILDGDTSRMKNRYNGG